MKLKAPLLIAAAIGLASCAAQPVQPNVAPAANADVAAPKQVYVIRHLQKAQGDDPPLTTEGAANAQRLAAFLAGKGIVAIFATPTRRTMQTAAPLANRLGISIRSYDPHDPDALVRAVAAVSGPVLVVGHSNTVPDLVDRLGGPAQPAMRDEDYGTLFVVGLDGSVETLQVR
ncbi:MAG TPA: histidine phosphatase family protein [Sphingomicrobium sp.]|nr:histidine phosphatase family protein [Sphingomicrobium sp.]